MTLFKHGGTCASRQTWLQRHDKAVSLTVSAILLIVTFTVIQLEA